MLLIALALSTAMSPDRWVPVGGATDDYREYLDKESVTRSGAKIIVWTRRDFLLGSRTAWNELEFDCLRRTGAVLAYIQDDGGTVSHSVVRPHREASPIPPNSVEETIFKLVCR
jgi:hypothetical protein